MCRLSSWCLAFFLLFLAHVSLIPYHDNARQEYLYLYPYLHSYLFYLIIFIARLNISSSNPLPPFSSVSSCMSIVYISHSIVQCYIYIYFFDEVHSELLQGCHLINVSKSLSIAPTPAQSSPTPPPFPSSVTREAIQLAYKLVEKQRRVGVYSVHPFLHSRMDRAQVHDSACLRTIVMNKHFIIYIYIYALTPQNTHWL